MTRLPPGGTLGILGGGQLGFMITQEAHRMGYKVAALDPDPTAPLSRLADHFVNAPFTDVAAALRIAEVADVVTVETEHIPSDVLEEVAKVTPVRPVPSVLHTVQDRLRQKEFLAANAFPQAAFHKVDSRADLEAAVAAVGTPCILKSRRGGYDGKGQARIMDATPESIDAAYAKLEGTPAVLEAFVDFALEVSALFARGVDGDVAFFPVAENVHVGGILHTTRVPARIPDAVARQVEGLGFAIAEALDHVGVMAVEMFVRANGEVLVNEIAPRVHNSGHYTFGACATSQFEQHLRAVGGLPLGDPSLLSPVVMLNILGDAWAGGEPEWTDVLAEPGARLHLYGKKHVRPGRKMGHILILSEDPDDAMATAERIHQTLPLKG